MFDTGTMIWRGPATTVLVEALLARRAEGDLAAARAAMARLAATPVDPGYVLHDVPLSRLEALVARAKGDETGYRRYAERYRALADRCEFEGHREIASAMR
jgi:hypothetical protein